MIRVAIALLLSALGVLGIAEAKFVIFQTTSGVGAPVVQMDGIKRAGFNTQIQGSALTYAFINGFQQGTDWPSPFFGYLDGTNSWNASILDSNGYPTVASYAGGGAASFGGGYQSPLVSENPGPYCFDGIDLGNGITTSMVRIDGATFTRASSGVSSCAHLGANGQPDGTTSNCNTAINASLGGDQQTITITSSSTPGYYCIGLTPVTSTASSNQTEVTFTDGGLTAMAVYSASDAADRVAGKIFRTAFKQPIVNFDPGFIRFMTWNGGNAYAAPTRWEDRSLPNVAGQGGGNGLYFCNSRPYTFTSGTDQYSLPTKTASGCSQDTGATPASAVHGEHVIAYVTNSISQFGRLNITGGISNGSGGAGTNLVVTSVTQGCPGVGVTITGSGVTAGTHITSGPSNCATGTYQVNTSQLVSSTALSNTMSPQVNCSVVGLTTGSTTTVQTTDTCLSFAQSADKVILYLQDGANPTTSAVTGTLKNLNRWPRTATFVDATHFTVDYNSTGTGAFPGCGTATNCYVAPYECLSVNTRGIPPYTCYPIIESLDGYGSVEYESAYAPTAGTYTAFTFDKLLSGQTDGSGNEAPGVWLPPINLQPTRQVPIEIQVALINEINAMYTTQAPTHLWVTVPAAAIVPQTPDYSSGSDYPQNMYNTIMNGANGYAGLCAKCGVIIENSNETWNFGAIQESTFVYQHLGWLRWGIADWGSYSTLRAMWVEEDIKNASAYAANASRTRFTLGYWGHGGQSSGGSLANNEIRVYGTNTAADSVLNSDTQNPVYTGTTLTGTISGGTLTSSGVTGSFGIGYALTYSGMGTACIVTAGSGSTWSVQDVSPSQTTTPGNCAAVSGASMTAAPAPLTYFDQYTGDNYFDMGNTQYSTDIGQGTTDYGTMISGGGSCSNGTCTGTGSSAVNTDISQFVNDLIDAGCVSGSDVGIACSQLQHDNMAAILNLFGKYATGYEGGIDSTYADPNNGVYYCGLFSSAANCMNFMQQVFLSQGLANGILGYTQHVQSASGQSFPSAMLDEICINASNLAGVPNWTWTGGACLDAFFASSTEGAVMANTWNTITTFNNALKP